MSSSTASDPEPGRGELDDEQKAAVSASERAIAVLAGPGSGKTRTLSYRTRHLLLRDESPHSCALLLTFTNKAAAEMKARTLGVSELPSRRIQASTFHTFGAEVLRSHGPLVGVAQDFHILDIDEQRELASEISSARGLLDAWSAHRLRRMTPPLAVREFGASYQAAKRAEQAVDFDDLVVEVGEILSSHPALAQAYGARFRHILVDEFQDTNAAQFAIVELLAVHASTVSIFADDDQAIFGFAGAEAENIGRFARALDAKVYPLTTNYRSGKRIVAVANRLIQSDGSASGRVMRSHRSGGEVEFCRFANEQEEARQIGAAIAGSISAGRPVSDHAILVRSGHRANAVLQELRSRGVPVTDWRGETHAPADRRILSACLAVVRGTLAPRQVKRLCELMRLPESEERKTAAFLAAHGDAPLVQGLEAVRRLAFSGATPHEVAKAVQAACVAQSPIIGHSLDGIVEAIGHFELYDREFTLEHLLSELSLGTIGRPPTEGGGVKVASLHRTKGLQWRTVYLLGLEKGHLPDFRTRAESMRDERRLCFVGVSRAEERLVVTYSRTTNGYTQQMSLFAGEMGLA